MAGSPKFIMFVGLPGSGKSTFRKKLDVESPIYLSTDDLIEHQAFIERKTYNDVFESTIDRATKYLNKQLTEALQNKSNIVLDQTNLTQKSRNRKMSQIPKEYEKICYVFDKKIDYILDINKKREDHGRYLPITVLTDMYERFEMPTEKEFDKIFFVVDK